MGYIDTTGSSVQINLPKTALNTPGQPGMEDHSVEQHAWSVTGLGPISRLRGRPAPCTSPRKPSSEIRAGRTKTWEKFEVPDEGIGCGFTEAVRGVLSHHMVIATGRSPTTIPILRRRGTRTRATSYGTPGPYEDAVQGQPIFEENDREHFKGIDIMRTVRSFDPCLPCGVHMYLGGGKKLELLHSPTQSLTRRVMSLFPRLCGLELAEKPRQVPSTGSRAHEHQLFQARAHGQGGRPP